MLATRLYGIPVCRQLGIFLNPDRILGAGALGSRVFWIIYKLSALARLEPLLHLVAIVGNAPWKGKWILKGA